jgi:2-iminobutanoate/2-iminopropanoate deaminase
MNRVEPGQALATFRSSTMKSGTPRITAVLLCTALAAGCSVPRDFGLPWVPQGPGISPEEARAQRQGRPAAAPASAAAAAAPAPSGNGVAPARLAAVEPGAWGSPPADAQRPAPPAAARPAATAPAVAVALAPSGVGPGYTQAARYGDLLFISGQIPMDPKTLVVAADAPIEEQTRLALENLRWVLDANRLTMANVVSTTVYLKNINDLREMDSAYSRFFNGALPARTVVEVARLPRGVLVQISAVAGR